MKKKIRPSDSAGRACYVLRNQWMIDDSDFVIFHLDENNSANDLEEGATR